MTWIAWTSWKCRNGLKNGCSVHPTLLLLWFSKRLVAVRSSNLRLILQRSIYMLMKSCFSSRETANCLIIQVFTLMKHYSMDLEHGVQPNYHPSTQAVKSDYSLASQWVVQTSFLFSSRQRRVTAFFSSTLPFKNMRFWTFIHDRNLLRILRISVPYKESPMFLQTLLFLYNLSSMFT